VEYSKYRDEEDEEWTYVQNYIQKMVGKEVCNISVLKTVRDRTFARMSMSNASKIGETPWTWSAESIERLKGWWL
jgi:hypothetical protein